MLIVTGHTILVSTSLHLSLSLPFSPSILAVPLALKAHSSRWGEQGAPSSLPPVLHAPCPCLIVVILCMTLRFRSCRLFCRSCDWRGPQHSPQLRAAPTSALKVLLVWRARASNNLVSAFMTTSPVEIFNSAWQNFLFLQPGAVMTPCWPWTLFLLFCISVYSLSAFLSVWCT